MADPPRRSIPVQVPSTPVEVDGPPIIMGELRLSDGTVLNIMVVVPSISRVDGVKDPAGKPMYMIESQIVFGVKQWKREEGH